MLSWGGFNYTYDPLDGMATLTGGGLNKAYSYDAEGERLWFREGATGPWTYTLRGLDGKVLREYGFDGTSWSWGKDYAYRGGQLLAAIDGSGTRHFTLDHLGSPRLITDGGRNAVEYHAFWAYGEEIDTACGAERMKFTGHERDNQCVTGMLDYMHARYYNPVLGRFLAVDEGNGKPEAPASWNRYGYAADDPIARVDLEGRTDIYFVVVRTQQVGAATMGQFQVLGTGIRGWTLEGPGGNVRYISRIPEGAYETTYEWSPHFRANKFRVNGVPSLEPGVDRTGLLYHPGTSVGGTEGCILWSAVGARGDKLIKDENNELEKQTVQYYKHVKEEDTAKGEKTRIVSIFLDLEVLTQQGAYFGQGDSQEPQLFQVPPSSPDLR